MRYVIIGAGAIGGTLGGRLAQHSPQHPPLLIARGDHGAAIARDGLRLRTPDEDSTLRVDVATGPAAVRLSADDVLVVATKTQQARDALLQWVDAPVFDDAGSEIGIAGDVLPVLITTNGVAAERMALRLFERVFGVCVWLPAVHLVPGEVIVRMAPMSGTFIIGRYAAPEDAADRQLLSVIEADWTASSFTVRLVDDVMRWKYTKLLSNLGNAPQALIRSVESFDGVVEVLRAEAEVVLRDAGIEWAGEDEEAEWRGEFAVRPVAGVPEELGGSSWQSIARGTGSIETDYLNGEIVYLARSRGGSAPLNQVVQRLARRASSSGVGVGSLTLAEFELELARA
jgi:2-dehydropantoate 2-reductase